MWSLATPVASVLMRHNLCKLTSVKDLESCFAKGEKKKRGDLAPRFARFFAACFRVRTLRKRFYLLLPWSQESICRSRSLGSCVVLNRWDGGRVGGAKVRNTIGIFSTLCEI